MVVGARTKKSKVSLLRRPGKKILSIAANYLWGMKIPDLNSGFRALKKSVAMEYTYNFKTERHDAGDKFRYVKAIVDSALEREDLSGEIERYLRKIVAGGKI